MNIIVILCCIGPLLVRTTSIIEYAILRKPGELAFYWMLSRTLIFIVRCISLVHTVVYTCSRESVSLTSMNKHMFNTQREFVINKLLLWPLSLPFNHTQNVIGWIPVLYLPEPIKVSHVVITKPFPCTQTLLKYLKLKVITQSKMQKSALII